MRKNGQLLSFAYLIVFFLGVMFGLESIVPLFFASVGVSVFEWGILAFVSTLGMLFFEMIWGMLSDRFGKPRLIGGGLLASATVITAYALPFFLPLFLVLQALRGVFSVMSAPPTRMLVSELSSPTKLAVALGLWFSATRLGATVGSVFFSYIAQEVGYAPAFISCSALLFIVGFVALIVLRRAEPSVREPEDSDAKMESKEPPAGQTQRNSESELDLYNFLLRSDRFPSDELDKDDCPNIRIRGLGSFHLCCRVEPSRVHGFLRCVLSLVRPLCGQSRQEDNCCHRFYFPSPLSCSVFVDNRSFSTVCFNSSFVLRILPCCAFTLGSISQFCPKKSPGGINWDLWKR